MLKLVAIVAVGVLLAVLAYSKYLDSQKDIHELALSEQSNISPTRKNDETAIYRNNQTPHGLPLLTGLQIRHGFKLRNGNLRDIWSIVMGQKNINSVTFIENGNEIKTDVYHLHGIFEKLNLFFKDHEITTVGIAVPLYSFHGFVSSFTCFVNGLTAHHFNHLPRTNPDVDVLIVDEKNLSFALRLDIKLIIVVSEDPLKSFSQQNVINWNELGDLTSLNSDTYSYNYDPEYDSGVPFKDTFNFATTDYSHQNFVSAIATVARSLPLGHELSHNDTLLIGYDDSSVKYWAKIFSVLLFGGSIVVGSSSTLKFDETLIEKYRPTILAIDSKTAKRFFLKHEPKGIIHSLLVSRVNYLLSRGIFSTMAALNEYKSLRLIYIDQLNSSNENNSSAELNQIRSLTGARVISERLIPGVIGSILNTNFYDYRVFTNSKLKNCGTSSLSLEIKLYKYNGLNIEKRHGELCIRGFIIGKPNDEKNLEEAIQKGERVGSEGWMPTGIIGKFGVDGCFYEDQ
ncbi:unnamed protein product [Wickerhamomyces anomalus]